MKKEILRIILFGIIAVLLLTSCEKKEAIQPKVALPTELKEAIKKYIEAADKGPAVEQIKIIKEGYSIASTYSLAHPNDPWGVYVTLYGEAAAFFDVPSGLLFKEVLKKLPEKQADLAKKLIQARQRGLSGKDDYFRTLHQMKQDLSSLVYP